MPATCLWLWLVLPDAPLVAQESLCGKINQEGKLSIKARDWERADELCNCNGLQRLEMKKVPLLHLPPCFDQLQELQHLDLSKSNLVRFPPEVLRMESLQYLSLAHTRIQLLPDEIADMPALRHLDLRGTGVEDLPADLQHLEVIDMRLILLSKVEQDELRARFPNTQIFLSSPCHCH